MTTGNDWLDQARRLVAGLGQSLAAGAAASPAAGQDGEGPHGEAPHGVPYGEAPHGSDCRWCPLCTAVAVLRGERPEVTAALADTLTAAAAALRTLAAEPPAARPAGPAAGADAQPGPVVQHIEIA